jgi:hypothetical protein
VNRQSRKISIDLQCQLFHECQKTKNELGVVLKKLWDESNLGPICTLLPANVLQMAGLSPTFFAFFSNADL